MACIAATAASANSLEQELGCFAWSLLPPCLSLFPPIEQVASIAATADPGRRRGRYTLLVLLFHFFVSLIVLSCAILTEGD